MKQFKYIQLGLIMLFFIILLHWLLYYQKNSIFMLIWKRQHNQLSTLNFSTDGSFLASGSQDGIIKLWRIRDGNLMFILNNKHSVNSIVFSTDGQILISGGDDGIVNFWSIKNRRLIRPSLIYKDIVKILDFSPIEELLALVIDNTIVIQQFSKGHLKLKRTFRASQPIYCGAFSPDGKFLALGGGGNYVEVYQVSSGQLRYTFGRHIGSIFSIAFSPCGGLLVSGGEYDNIKVWRLKDNKLMCTLKGHQGLTGLGWVSFLSFSPDGQLLISGGGDGKVRVWRTQKWFVLGEKRFDAPISCISFSPKGQFLAIGDNNGFIYLFKIIHK